MMRQTLLRFGFTAGLAFAALTIAAHAQTNGLSASLVLRSQAASIAEETASHFVDSMSVNQRVGILVDGGSARLLVENAFLELFERKGIRGVLPGPQGNPRQMLHVTVLDQSVRYSPIASGDYRREVLTAVEARRTVGDSSGTSYLGMFKRHDVDTVAFREDVGVMGSIPEKERTLFDRLLGPILLIGGAFLASSPFRQIITWH